VFVLHLVECGSFRWLQSTRRLKLPIIKSYQFLARTQRSCDITENLSVFVLYLEARKIPTTLLRTPLRKTVGPRSMPFGAISLLKSIGAETVFLAAAVS